MGAAARRLAVAAIIAAAATGLLLPPVAAAAQSPPPDGEWLSFETPNYRVTYMPELEPLARRAAAVAERTHAILTAELGDPPPGPTDLVVTNHVDYSNGLANIFPSNRIIVYARPPTGTPQLAYARDWIELVVAHEVVHVFHLGESSRFGRALRAVFGRVPMIWPIFPVAGSPNWNVEGLATWYESRLTGAGRVPGSFHDMIARTAALEDRIPDLDDLSAPHPAWPGGQKSYGYGSRLMAWIADRYGPQAHAAIVEATGASLRPTFLAFDHVAENALGEPFDVLWDQWRRAETLEALELERELEEQGLTELTPVAGRGPFAGAPRASPDGRFLSFAAHDYRSDPATRLVDLSTGAVRTVSRRSQFGGILGPAAWLPGGDAFVVAQLEMTDPYRAYSDLWRVTLDGTETQLTHGQRLAQPDVAPDGRRVAAVHNVRGALDLVVHDLEAGETRTLVEAAPGEAFDSPRWSPDGRRIAATRFADGRVDVVVIEVESGRVSALTDDDALDLGPVWSPDGERLFWSSDRSGIPNILATAVAGGPVYQVTNVRTGAFDPELSPDGRVLYLSVYHHDGWRIERARVDPESWVEAPESSVVMEAGLLPEPAPATDVEVTASRPYAPWPTLRPYHWLPEWTSYGGEGGTLDFVGFATGGRDVLARHEWDLSAGVDVGTGRLRAAGDWTYRGLGEVELRLAARHGWEGAGAVTLTDGGSEAIYRRRDRVGAEVILWRQRWRSRGWLRVGAEAERSELEAHDLTEEELLDEGWELAPARRTVGVWGGPGYSNARLHPFSISPQDGISVAVSVGRWWNLEDGGTAWDQVIGSGAGYLGLPVGGFADHVLALRIAGLARRGADAVARSIGGVPGGASPLPAGATELLGGGISGGAFFPVRGFASGARAGTRVWSASGEWRFPLVLRDLSGGVLGFSLTAVSGSLFADAASAWCPEKGEDAAASGCSGGPWDPLVSSGAELGIDFGALHNQRVFLRVGAAQPLRGPGEKRPTLYLSAGRAF